MRALFIIMCALVILGVSIAKIYYSDQNAVIDPRIKKARELYKNYNAFAQNGDYDSIFLLMDSIELIYSQVKHYQNTFEVGVLNNNRAAAYLTLALHSTKVTENTVMQDSLVNLAKISVKKSITLYEAWLRSFENATEKEIGDLIMNSFYIGLEDYDPELKKKFYDKRIEEIEESITETKRRLSVSYTNLGVINRHEQQYEMAAQNYKRAIDLWDKNLTAENNLNMLLGRPLKKRNLIQNLFPAKRIEN